MNDNKAALNATIILVLTPNNDYEVRETKFLKFELYERTKLSRSKAMSDLSAIMYDAQWPIKLDA